MNRLDYASPVLVLSSFEYQRSVGRVLSGQSVSRCSPYIYIAYADSMGNVPFLDRLDRQIVDRFAWLLPPRFLVERIRSSGRSATVQLLAVVTIL